ncbi:MAG: TolB-like protein/Tfp pilus assembly protein PilF [Lysobacterales bacterium]|jgi:TolB-like protein/Tfp pilus assembly protein PilF
MSFFNELKRRNVFRVAFAYSITGWLIAQIAGLAADSFGAPGWVMKMIITMLLLGFPVAMVMAWAYDLTPDGIRRDAGDEAAQSASKSKLDHTITFVLVVALAYFAFDKFVLDPRRDTKLVNTTQEATLEVTNQTPVAQETLAEQPNDKSIAVIPFQNRSANEENAEFFSDGVHDELLTNLSKISALKVISRTSVMSYRDTTKNLRQIGEELGVANILEGGVQRAGNTVRINVQLINATTDEHIWADIYDRELTAENIFAIQSEIAEAIAVALKATLSPGEQKQLEAVPTESLEAYDNWLVAGQLIERDNWQDLHDAQSHLARAIELDPLFVQAHVLLARSFGDLFETGALTLQEVKKPWGDAIEAALALDINSADAQAVNAHYLWRYEATGADEAWERALQLEPANAKTLDMYGQYLRKTFQFNKALQVYQQALELDPVSIGILHGLARVHQARGESDKALELFARIRQIDPASSSGIGPVAGLYMDIGDLSQSLRWLSKGREIDPEDSDLSNWIVRNYFDLGDFERARQWLTWTRQNQNLNPMVEAGTAMLHILEGRVDEAAELASLSLQENTFNRWGSETIAFRCLLIGALKSGQADKTLELIGQTHPELFLATPNVDAGNALQAIDTAHLLQMAGQPEIAQKLLMSVIALYEQPHVVSEMWLRTGKAQALALLGKQEDALSELQSQMKSGWRVFWQWDTELNPNFQSLHGTPEFEDILGILKADMARQLENVRTLEATGEIPPPPGDDSS